MNMFLKNEKSALEQKITQAREKGNEGTYKNLIQAYERILNLIYQDEDRNNSGEILYFEANKDCIYFYIGNEVIRIIISKNKKYQDNIKENIINNYNIKYAYGDMRGLGLHVAKLLNLHGIKTKNTKVTNINYNNINNNGNVKNTFESKFI